MAKNVLQTICGRRRHPCFILAGTIAPSANAATTGCHFIFVVMINFVVTTVTRWSHGTWQVKRWHTMICCCLPLQIPHHYRCHDHWRLQLHYQCYQCHCVLESCKCLVVLKVKISRTMICCCLPLQTPHHHRCHDHWVPQFHHHYYRCRCVLVSCTFVNVWLWRSCCLLFLTYKQTNISALGFFAKLVFSIIVRQIGTSRLQGVKIFYQKAVYMV